MAERWTPEQLADLRERLVRHETFLTIARATGRTRSAIAGRVKRLRELDPTIPPAAPPVPSTKVEHTPIDETPVVDAVEPIAVEDPVVEDPVVEDPVVEDPVVEDPVVEDPTQRGVLLMQRTGCCWPVRGGRCCNAVLQRTQTTQTTVL